MFCLIVFVCNYNVLKVFYLLTISCIYTIHFDHIRLSFIVFLQLPLVPLLHFPPSVMASFVVISDPVRHTCASHLNTSVGPSIGNGRPTSDVLKGEWLPLPYHHPLPWELLQGWGRTPLHARMLAGWILCRSPQLLWDDVGSSPGMFRSQHSTVLLISWLLLSSLPTFLRWSLSLAWRGGNSMQLLDLQLSSHSWLAWHFDSPESLR